MNALKPAILVVDDDIDIASNIADILEDCGYRTDKAYDGAMALDLASQSKYDVALLDYKMSDIDGATLCAKLKQVQPDLITIMITAYAGNDGVQKAFSVGTWQVLSKPVNMQELLDFIAEAVA